MISFHGDRSYKCKVCGKIEEDSFVDGVCSACLYKEKVSKTNSLCEECKKKCKQSSLVSIQYCPEYVYSRPKITQKQGIATRSRDLGEKTSKKPKEALKRKKRKK